MTMRYSGAHVSGGKVYLACVELVDADQCVRVTGAGGRFEFNNALGEAERVADLADRLREDLTSSRAQRVGVVQTRLFSGLQYKIAYERVLAISAVMSAALQSDMSFRTLKTEAIASTVGVPAKSLARTDFKTVGFDTAPKYWSAGLAIAFAGATHLAVTHGDTT